MTRRSTRINHLLDDAAAHAVANGKSPKQPKAKKEVEESGFQIIRIRAPRIASVDITILGRSPFLIHAFSLRARAGVLRTFVTPGNQKGSAPRPPKDPRAEYEDAFYRPIDELTNELFFPARSTKAMLCSAYKMTAGGKFWRAFAKVVHIRDNWIRLYGTPVPDCQPVRLPRGKMDLRFRPRLDEWAAVIPIEYLEDTIDVETICNVINLGGYGVGLGDSRPDGKENCNGTNGRFRVVAVNDKTVDSKLAKHLFAVMDQPQSMRVPDGWDGLGEMLAMAEAQGELDPEDTSSDEPSEKKK